MFSQQNKNNIFYYGNIFFLIGTFFLSSALPISAIFFLIAIIISFKKYKFELIHDKWNYPLFISIGLIIFSTASNSILNIPNEIHDINKSTLWISTLNWIPMFFVYWGSQIYLKNNKQRELFIKVLIAGSIPIIISCILQYWFKVFGPFETLNGLIVWFQKPLIRNDGISGLFSNQNYTGFWFAMLWPFSIFLFRRNYTNKFKKILLAIINFFVLYFGILTNSRNSVLGLILIIPILFGLKTFFTSIFILIILTAIYILLLNNSLINNQNLVQFIPVALLEKITTFNINSINSIPRFEIWDKAYNLIIRRPLLGWGASSFAALYLIKGGLYKIQHTHNLPLELSYNFGIPLSLILSSFFILLIYKGWKTLITNDDKKLSLDLHWLTSVTVVYLLQLSDITYYDGKISLIIWILLAGLKCIINEQQLKLNI